MSSDNLILYFHRTYAHQDSHSLSIFIEHTHIKTLNLGLSFSVRRPKKRDKRRKVPCCRRLQSLSRTSELKIANGEIPEKTSIFNFQFSTLNFYDNRCLYNHPLPARH